MRYEDVYLFNALSMAHAEAIGKAATAEFVEDRVSSVYLLYNEFKSVMQQRVIVERLLPIPRLDEDAPASGEAIVDYLYEPTPERIFNDLIPRHVDIQVYRGLLESAAAEQAARMTAMDAATKELRGSDRSADPPHEQGASGEHHARDHRGRVRRRRVTGFVPERTTGPTKRLTDTHGEGSN